jgi:hypothetical protein
MVKDIVEWLLDSDPALRWQVERDLIGAPEDVWQATRARVATEGFGARLLALQDDDGQWAGGAFFPAGFFDDSEARNEPGQPWTATTWTLNSLREWGLGPVGSRRYRREVGGQQPLGVRRPPVLGRRGGLLHQRLDSRQRRLARSRHRSAGGVVRRASNGGRRLELRMGGGLDPVLVPLHAQLPQGVSLRYELATGGTEATRSARRAGEEYLLERRLMYGGCRPARRWRRGRTVLPTRSGAYYSVLNAADYFRSASLHDGADPDPRMAEAMETIRGARQIRWHLVAGAPSPGPGLVRGRRRRG